MHVNKPIAKIKIINNDGVPEILIRNVVIVAEPSEKVKALTAFELLGKISCASCIG